MNSSPRRIILSITFFAILLIWFTGCTTHINPNPISTQNSSLNIINNSSYTIEYFYLSLSTNTSWGNDLLGSTNTIASGTSLQLNNIPAGTYDMKAQTMGSPVRVAIRTNIIFPSNAIVSWTLIDGYFTLLSGIVKVVNNSSTKIYYLFIRPAGNSSWGVNQLDTNTIAIASGTSSQIDNIPVGSYDLRAESQNHAQYVQVMNQSVTSGGILTWTISTF